MTPPSESNSDRGHSIWKYTIPVKGSFEHDMPIGAQVLYVDVQNGEPLFWARVAVGAATERRKFYVCGTGHPLPADGHYLGSFQLHGGAFVGHLLEP